MSHVALIPARAGSKGLPGKNTKLFHGKPMIAYTIEAAIESGCFSGVFVSTDDPVIQQIALELGATAMSLRPAHLADDNATTLMVIRYFIDWYETEYAKRPETLTYLQPTSPLRNASHIQQGVTLYQQAAQLVSVVGMTREKPVAWQGHLQDSGHVVLHAGLITSTNRQQQPQNLIINGAFYCTDVLSAYENGLLHHPILPLIMPREVSVDVDTLADFELAEWHMSRQHTPVGVV